MIKDQPDLYQIRKTKVTRLSDAEAELIAMLRRLSVWRGWGDTFTRVLAIAIGEEDIGLKPLIARTNATVSPAAEKKPRKKCQPKRKPIDDVSLVGLGQQLLQTSEGQP
jgi:hypothetical protein